LFFGGSSRENQENRRYTMEDLKGSKTQKNLSLAFAGESQANRKYLAFAKQADKEGYRQIAKLFRAAAGAETVHAHAHLRTLGGIQGTAENLKDAISGETHEFKEMYPAMIEEAKAEGYKAAERSFTYANEVEKAHAALYQKALDKLDALEETDYYVCSVCGYTCEGEPPEKCPVCGAKSSAFSKVE
jgi:rubrerythrin